MSDLSRQNGARWEAYIRAECRALEAAGRAYVSKNWEAPKVRGSHVKWEVSKPDFSGFLPDGRHVVFEAKAMLEMAASFPIARIADHQLEHLHRAHTNGAEVFVYLLRGHEKWVLPWAYVFECSAHRASVPLIGGSHLMKRDGETWLDTWGRLGACDLTHGAFWGLGEAT